MQHTYRERERRICLISFYPPIQVEDLKAKLASQEAQLTFKKQNIEALIAKIGLQTEKVSSKRKAADVEAQKVRRLCWLFRQELTLPAKMERLSPLTGLGCPGLPQVAVIQTEVSARQKECEDDLAKAEPLLTAATAALHTLNKVPDFIHLDVDLEEEIYKITATIQ